MSGKMDNIAAQVAAGQERAEQQRTNEAQDAAAQKASANVDRVGAVAQDAPGAAEGLIGGARSTAPVQGAATANRKPFGERVQSAIELINDYELQMGASARVNTDIIDDQQARLYNALVMILQADDNADFAGAMEFLFRKFREDKHGAFCGTRLRRRINFMRQPSGDKAMLAYTGFLDLLQVFSNAANRRMYWSRFNKAAVLVLISNPAHRQRLETYMNNISR